MVNLSERFGIQPRDVDLEPTAYQEALFSGLGIKPKTQNELLDKAAELLSKPGHVGTALELVYGKPLTDKDLNELRPKLESLLRMKVKPQNALLKLINSDYAHRLDQVIQSFAPQNHFQLRPPDRK
jgi:hypothetical protein